MSAENIKLNIIEKLLLLDNLDTLLKIQSFLGKTLKNGESQDKQDGAAIAQTFEDWNRQFEDDENTNLDEFLPEHGVTLRQFRQTIWEGEQSDTMTFEAFLEDQKSWRK
jgi:hypothetical protein